MSVSSISSLKEARANLGDYRMEKSLLQDRSSAADLELKLMTMMHDMTRQRTAMMQEMSQSITNNLTRRLSQTNRALSSIAERHIESDMIFSVLAKSHFELTERFSRGDGSLSDLESFGITIPDDSDSNPDIAQLKVAAVLPLRSPLTSNLTLNLTSTTVDSAPF